MSLDTGETRRSSRSLREVEICETSSRAVYIYVLGERAPVGRAVVEHTHLNFHHLYVVHPRVHPLSRWIVYLSKLSQEARRRLYWSLV